MYYRKNGGDIMNYDELADIIGREVLSYEAKDESFIEVYETCLKKHGNFTSRESNKILTKVIHVITILGYDIDSTNPCRFKRYM